MHVLSVIHYPVFGGPHNRNASVIPLTAECGVETTVLLPDEPGDAAERMRAQGVDVVTAPLHRLRAQTNLRVHARMLASFPGEVRRIRQLIRARQIDLVLVNGLVNPHAAIAARLEGVPVTWQLLDTFPPRALRLALMPLVRLLADSLMTSGVEVARAHPGASTFGERLVSFFPIVDTDRFRPDPALRASARRELGLPEDAIVVGNVSNLNPMKGHLTFVRAAGSLKSSYPDVRYVILGGSYDHHADYIASIRRESQAVGLDAGEQLMVRDPGTRVAELAAAFDIFWLTSEPRSEGLSTVVGEAMALGLPVVATDVGSVSESVDHGTTGFMVPPRDPEALATATRPLVVDPKLRSAMGIAGRHRAEALFNGAACTRKHLSSFEAAVARHKQRRMRRPRAPKHGSD